MKRKLEDVIKKLGILYDKLREGMVSEICKHNNRTGCYWSSNNWRVTAKQIRAPDSCSGAGCNKTVKVSGLRPVSYSQLRRS